MSDLAAAQVCESLSAELCPDSSKPSAAALISILESSLHARSSEWLFLRELKVGTGRRNGSVQRLDAFALNCLPHQAMKRICYEVKTSRADFLCELRHPLKRRIGMRYSNEFYFVTPGEMLDPNEVPVECGLIEAGYALPDRWLALQTRQSGYFDYDPATNAYCMVIVPAPWRDTPGPTWQFAAAMLRNQQRQLEEAKPNPRPEQQRLSFS
ncbi:MAG TPA: hypothetical protein VLJ11_17800 [Bryobacteraceae bacterium]|nr:hypothetical protein [Bryobacteraceae bacterium]